MIHATIIRDPSTDEGTFGALTLDTGLILRTAELPWRGNRRRISCIPDGIYECRWGKSERFGDCYHVEDVPDRDGILFHRGNYAGDTSKGYQSDVEGCILLGMEEGELVDGQRAVLRSRTAIFNFHHALREQPFVLEIRWAAGSS